MCLPGKPGAVVTLRQEGAGNRSGQTDDRVTLRTLVAEVVDDQCNAVTCRRCFRKGAYLRKQQCQQGSECSDCPAWMTGHTPSRRYCMRSCRMDRPFSMFSAS